MRLTLGKNKQVAVVSWCPFFAAESSSLSLSFCFVIQSLVLFMHERGGFEVA